jgi:hypothetical protein
MLLAMLARVARGCLVALYLACLAEPARADGPFEGEWRQGAMHIDVRVETWGPDCGPRPQSSTVPARGTVRVAQEGDHLSFAGRRSTRSCWSDNRAVRLVSSRVQSGTWQILCRTPADDPRRETGSYTLRASGSDRIELRDETAYDWTLNESHCTAQVTTTQTFERVSGGTGSPEPTPEPRPEPTPEPAPEPACTPGAPARVAIRPGSAELEPGERACFQARVLDAQGCAVRGASAEIALAPGSVGSLRAGCFESSTEGSATLIARSGSQEGRAALRVRALDLSGLVARRAEIGTVDGSGAASAGQEAGVAARATTPATSVSPWLVALAVGAIGLATLAGVLLAVRAARRKAELAERARRRAEQTSVVPPAPAPPREAPAGGAQAMICPLCRRGYGAEVMVCPKDREHLVPYAEFVARREQSVPDKVCPTCGARYPGTTKFCGKDGATLVAP